MKKVQIFGLATILIITLTTITGVYAKDKQDTTLATYKKDITGDKQQDRIDIKGSPDGKNFNAIEIEIVTSKNKKFNIPLSSHQKPKVLFKDLNQDGIKDLFVMALEIDKENANEYHLYSFKDDQFINIELPDPLSLTAQYENDYQASIVIDKTGNEYRIDLKSKMENFERTGLYQNGRLNEPTELLVHTFQQITPVRLRDMKMGLRASQRIGDSYSGASIANVVSIWKWTNERWELHKTVVKTRGSE